MQTLNIAGYQFVTLNDLPLIKTHFLQICEALQLKGTILLSKEGININLAGCKNRIHEFKKTLQADARFVDIRFRESYSTQPPFKRLKIKIKNEIITFRHDEIQPEKMRAQSLTPEELKQWLDEKRDILLLDTRNDYEIQFGTFANAVNLKINDFCEFAHASEQLTQEKPIVMFCTGGIRCEKAGLHLLNKGFSKVYQLDGGILNYFAKIGGTHYHGECFVFDERVALNTSLQSTGTTQCKTCQGPIRETCHVCQEKQHSQTLGANRIDNIV